MNGITIKREHMFVNKRVNKIRMLYSAPGTLILEDENFPNQIQFAKYWNNTKTAAVVQIIKDTWKSLLVDNEAMGRLSMFWIDELCTSSRVRLIKVVIIAKQP